MNPIITPFEWVMIVISIILFIMGIVKYIQLINK